MTGSDPRAVLRQTIWSGRAFLRNPVGDGERTCSICTGSTNSGFIACYKCGHAVASSTPDLLGFVTYAWPNHQSGRTMYAYKDTVPSPSNDLVAAMLTYALVTHWSCMAAANMPPDSWAVVPSLKGRAGQHPFEALAGPVLSRFPRTEVAAAPTIVGPREYRPANFVVGDVLGTHVLLLDDTWVSGNHLRSVTTALREAGVARVTGVVVARWLEPVFAEKVPFIGPRKDAFDPDLCPFTGGACKSTM